MFEDVMMDWAGKERVGNLFCLRVRDAEGITGVLENAIKNNTLKNFNTDAIRYSSLNLKSLHQYGSLEFRGLPFNGDFENIQTWIEMLLCIKDASLKIENPRELVSLLSKRGGDALANDVFGDLIQHFPKVDWKSKLLGSIRLVQRLVYITDWEERSDSVISIATKLHEYKPDEEEPMNALDMERMLQPAPIGIRGKPVIQAANHVNEPIRFDNF